RAVRIALALAERMMLAVHRDPFFRRRAGIHPEPEPEEMPYGRVEIHRAVRLVAMKVQRDADHRDVHPDEGDGDVAPETEVQEALVVLEQEIHWLGFRE